MCFLFVLIKHLVDFNYFTLDTTLGDTTGHHGDGQIMI